MRVFSAVAAQRSFVAASRALGIPKATVSRKVQLLEHRLGVKLLVRTTRRVSLTEAGTAFQERCLRIEEGTLVPVMPGWTGQPVEVRAVFPSRAGLLPKTRAFIDHLAERRLTRGGRTR